MNPWRLVLTPLLLCLASCATEPQEIGEPGRGDEVLREGIHRDPQDFRTPPPLQPVPIDGTPETVKQPWKKAPASVRRTNAAVRGEATLTESSNRTVQDALDASQAESRSHQRDRLAVRRADGRKRARGTRMSIAALAEDGRARREAARADRTKREAAEVQAIIDRLREQHPAERPFALQAAAQEHHASLRFAAEQARGAAQRKREQAGRARRFAETTASQGVIVPAARVDAQRAERDAIALELEADQAEAEAHWAALAQRRILRGLLDPRKP